MISGFSAELLKVFMKGGDFSEFTPYSTLNSTISDERYNSIRLVLNESTEREL